MSSLYLPGSVWVIVAYMPSTPVHFPAQLAKRCGAVAGSVASAPSTGTVSTGTSVVVVSVGAGAGASAFSQPASNTSAAALAMITRSEEHTSDLQSLMRTSYAVFCLTQKTI